MPVFLLGINNLVLCFEKDNAHIEHSTSLTEGSKQQNNNKKQEQKHNKQTLNRHYTQKH